MKSNIFLTNKKYLMCYLFLFTVAFFLFLALFTIIGRMVYTPPAKPVTTTNNVVQKPAPAPVKTEQQAEKPKPKKQVALTFDDGPGKDTKEILDILEVYDVKATFFILGAQAKKSPDLIKREAEAGHAIANHTYDHKNLKRLSSEGVKKEILMAEQVITSQKQEMRKLLRPPGGNHNEDVDKMISKLGYKLVLWTVDTRDWASKDADSIFAIVKRDTQNNSIILMHDGGGDRSSTVKALPRIIEYLRKQGYEFITL